MQVKLCVAANQISKDMGKYLAISIAMCVFAIANYLLGKENEDNDLKYWVSMIVSILCGIVGHIAFWMYIKSIM